MKNKKNILITGANGFIGRNTVKYLTEMSDEFNIYTTDIKDNLLFKNFIEAQLGEDNFIDKITNSLKNIDIIIHIAACIAKDDNSKDLIKTNCVGVIQISQLAQTTNCSKIIFLSSIQVIGNVKDIPIDENYKLEPNTIYHSTKIFGENIFNMINNDKIKTISLRIPSPIGADMPNNKIFSIFVDKCLKNKTITILGNGSRIQNYIDVKDIAHAIYCAIDNKNARGIYNIASPKGYSNLELAQTCIRVLKSDSKILFSKESDSEENNKWVISIEKAKEELSYNPKVSLEQTIIERKHFCENNVHK